jgi:hypothetical protein
MAKRYDHTDPPAVVILKNDGAGNYTEVTTFGGGGGATTDPDSNREATQLQIKTLLGTLGTQATLAAVLTALGPLATQTTLAAVLAALGGNLKTQEQASAPGTAVGDIPAGTSTGANLTLSGLGVVRVIIGATWTAADLTFETSTDGVTWNPLYDAYGNPVTYKAAANRSINVPVGDLLRINRVRARSGIPGAYVNQVAAASVTLVTAPL